MFKFIVAIFVTYSVATDCYAASGNFKTDKPGLLKLVHPRITEAIAFKFSGRIQISGQFLVAWREGRKGRQNLHVAFLPDEKSAARLPRMSIDAPVKELRFSNPEQAVSILLVPSAARKLLAKELLNVTGSATAIIHHYTVSVACDQRWYEAKLMTALRNQKVIMGGREQIRYGCG
jgi:hypothetical protein